MSADAAASAPPRVVAQVGGAAGGALSDDDFFEDARGEGEPAGEASAAAKAAAEGWPDEDGADADADAEDAYFGGGARAGAGAGSADAAAAAADGDGDGDGAGVGARSDDLVLADGRVLSRRARPRSEADEVEDGRKDASMAGACKDEGNRHFKAGAYETAAACYTEALRYVPRDAAFGEHRAVYYANRAACAAAQGADDAALYDCDRALEHNPRYAKALARRAAVLERLGKLDEAAADAAAWAAVEPRAAEPRAAVARLKAAITARDEKLKEEMLGKLKEMGNWVLGKFGMSMDNFAAVQDPATGSYSISFQK